MNKSSGMLGELEKAFERNPEGFLGAVPDSKVRAQKKKNAKRKRSFSLGEKLDYYSRRMKDKNLSKAQREFAQKRLKALKRQEQKVYVYNPPKSARKSVKTLRFPDLFDTLRHMKTVLGFELDDTKSGYKVQHKGKTVFVNVQKDMPNRHGFKIKPTKKQNVYALNISPKDVRRYQSIRNAIEKL